MKSLRSFVFLVLLLIIFDLSSGFGAIDDPAEQVVLPVEDVVEEQRYITIDFDNVDIRLFIKYISELTEKNFVIDKTVQGNVTIVSPTKISEEEAYHVFESVLEVHGFTTVPSGSVIKIVPTAAARSKNIETFRLSGSSYPQDKVVTQLIPLTHTSPDEMKKVLTPLVSKASVVIAHTQSGMLIVTETLSNIQRLLAIIESLDVEYVEQDMVVFPLENAAATTIAKILNTVYQKSGAVQKGITQKSAVKVVPYERVNSLVVLASTEEIRRVKSIITLLDTPVQRGEGNIHVFYLQNANAIELAKVLNALPGSQNNETEKGKAPSISKNVKVMADEETNSLIITASREEYNVLEGVIKKLDIPRQMVYLEALIMEVNTTRQFDVGVEWAAGGTFSDGTGTLVTGFSSNAQSPYSNIGGVNVETPSLPDGFSLGVLKQGIQIGGITFPNIAAILRAYENDSDINIIATPQILTTDNKKAEISVGENVPYIVSQNTTASEQDYTQYDYRDVATKLTITPQINQAETMRLDIETEIVKLKGNSLELTPTTFRRMASTSVILNDKDTVVIGGIIGQDATVSEIKVPLLGDIPFLGWLFKSRATQTTKTNMFIFITPRIIRNPADIANVTLEKEDNIEKVLPGVREELHRTMNKNHANILIEKGYQKLENNKVYEAEQYFQEALENDADNPYALLNMGVVSEELENYELALSYYRKVIVTGTKELAKHASENAKEGAPIVQLAKEGIERVHQGKEGLDETLLLLDSE